MIGSCNDYFSILNLNMDQDTSNFILSRKDDGLRKLTDYEILIIILFNIKKNVHVECLFMTTLK